MNQFKDLGITPQGNSFIGKKIEVEDVLNLEIAVYDWEIRDSTKKAGTKYLALQIELENKKRVVFTSGKILMDVIAQIPKEKFPFKTTIIKNDKRLEFS